MGIGVGPPRLGSSGAQLRAQSGELGCTAKEQGGAHGGTVTKRRRQEVRSGASSYIGPTGFLWKAGQVTGPLLGTVGVRDRHIVRIRDAGSPAPAKLGSYRKALRRAQEQRQGTEFSGTEPSVLVTSHHNAYPHAAEVGMRVGRDESAFPEEPHSKHSPACVIRGSGVPQNTSTD